ncbi:MAG TPA: hypothetical protein VGN16_11160 [Acidobacteriaceae bacterium]|jgi:hypothetical protein
MLSLTNEFNLLDIHSVRTLKQGAVFLLEGNGPKIVVKREELNEKDAKHFDLSRKAMGVIDKDVKASHRLSARELAALTGFVAHQKHEVNTQMMGRLPGATADLDLALNALGNSGTDKVWYKMPLVNMMTLQDAWDAKLGSEARSREGTFATVQQSDEPMRTFLKTLRASGGLESLGQVIAIDQFSGNKDRVRPQRSKRDFVNTNYPSAKYRLEVIQNVGNLMIIGTGKARTISGMDFADPNSMLKHADAALAAQTSQAGAEFWGTTIADPVKRKAFAKLVIADLETIFNSGPQKKKGFLDRMGDQTALGSDARSRLEKGMVKGAKVLVKYIDDRISRGKPYPQSFLDRAKVYRDMA